VNIHIAVVDECPNRHLLGRFHDAAVVIPVEVRQQIVDPHANHGRRHDAPGIAAIETR
jgi:hypothetical protein